MREVLILLGLIFIIYSWLKMEKNQGSRTTYIEKTIPEEKKLIIETPAKQSAPIKIEPKLTLKCGCIK